MKSHKWYFEYDKRFSKVRIIYSVASFVRASGTPWTRILTNRVCPLRGNGLAVSFSDSVKHCPVTLLLGLVGPLSWWCSLATDNSPLDCAAATWPSGDAYSADNGDTGADWGVWRDGVCDMYNRLRMIERTMCVWLIDWCNRVWCVRIIICMQSRKIKNKIKLKQWIHQHKSKIKYTKWSGCMQSEFGIW